MRPDQQNNWALPRHFPTPFLLSAPGWTELLWCPQLILSSSAVSSITCDAQELGSVILGLSEPQGTLAALPLHFCGLGSRRPPGKVEHAESLPDPPAQSIRALVGWGLSFFSPPAVLGPSAGGGQAYMHLQRESMVL